MDEKMKEVLKGIYENLTDEQKKKADACKTNDDIMNLVDEWGIELPDEVLDAVAGGRRGYSMRGYQVVDDIYEHVVTSEGKYDDEIERRIRPDY